MAARARFLRPLSVGIAGTATIFLVLFVPDFFVELWRIHEFQRLPEKERWPAASRLENGTALARRAAEDWYLGVFEEKRDEASLRALARMRSARAGIILVSLLRETLLRKKGVFTPCFIADRLREIGPAARLGKPALVELLFLSRRGIRTSVEPAWPEIHQSAVAALESVLAEPGMAAGILRNELEDPSWLIRLNAVRELGELGPDAALAIDSLIRRLEDPQPSIREMAATVLGSLGPAALAALPALGRGAARGRSESRGRCAVGDGPHSASRARIRGVGRTGSRDGRKTGTGTEEEVQVRADRSFSSSTCPRLPKSSMSFRSQAWTVW